MIKPFQGSGRMCSLNARRAMLPGPSGLHMRFCGARAATRGPSLAQPTTMPMVTAAATSTGPELQRNGTKPASKAPVIVWFKHDLRTCDHPGLSTALASGQPVLCFFCFDCKTLSDQLTCLWGLGVVHGAITDLRQRLKALNCPLVVRSGDTASELLQVVEATGAETVVCQSEVEQEWLLTEQSVQNALPQGVKLKTWRAPVWAAVTYTEPNFRAFSRRRGTPLEALPEARPQTTAPPPGVLPGDIPDVKTLQSVLETAVQPRFPAAPVRARTAVVSPDVDLVAERGWVYEALPELFTGGETTFLLALHAYLTNAPTRAGFITRMRAVVKKLEGIPGNESGSFTAVFQPALALGMLSRRQVYEEAFRYERERNGGVGPLFGRIAAPAAKAAAAVAECGDYHTGLAHSIRERPTQAGKAERRFWRWNGQMVDYLVAEPEGGVSEGTQTILLVHGFGAFAEHWRRNIPDLAGRGYRLFACTLPGFGPSEKSPQLYTTAMWKSYIRDFVVHIIQESTFIAGNSIGAVIPANACADHPHLFKGIVLINTAGKADRQYDPNAAAPSRAANELFVNITSWLIFQYLQRGIAKQLQRLYPTRPFNADAFLNDEIYRASCDPCALQVLRSGFYLAPQRPLPYMLNQLYQGPVLILQGVLDPLNNAHKRADDLEEAIPVATKVCIDAGHCPHDEVPELVNDAIANFVEQVVAMEGITGEESGEASVGVALESSAT